MSAGLNQRVKIWRMVNYSDDEVGGAQVTGTVVYENVLARIDSKHPEQQLLQQGYETIKTFTAILVPGTLDIRERDELEVTQPVDDVEFGWRYRIIGVQYSTHNRRDPRNYLMLNMVRSTRAHTKQ